MPSLDRQRISPLTPSVTGSQTRPASANPAPAAPAIDQTPTEQPAPVAPTPTDVSQVQLNATEAPTTSPESAAMQSVQDFFADGNLEVGEREQLVSLLNNNSIQLDDLTSDQQDQMNVIPTSDIDALASQEGVTQPPAELRIRSVDRLYVLPQESGQGLASNSNLSDRTTTLDREVNPATPRNPNGTQDVSYNFMMTADNTGRQQDGFFATQAQTFSGLAEDYANSNPALQPLAQNMSELYTLASQSQSTGRTARGDEAAAILERSAQTLEMLNNIPEDAMDPDSRRQIRQNIDDISAMAMAFPTLAGQPGVDTAFDKFAAKTIQRQRQIEGTAARGNRDRASETPDIQGALQTYTNDASDMRTFVGRFQALNQGLENGTFKNQAAYQQAMLEAAPGTSDRFQAAVGNLAQAQWTTQQAETRMDEASSLSSQALATQGQAQSRVDEASQNIGQARDLLTQYEALRDQSLGESAEAMGIRDQALDLMAQARSSNERVKSSAYSGDLSQFTSQVDQDLGQLQEQASQIAGIDALLQQRFAGSDYTADQVEERVRASENPEAQISDMVRQLGELTPGSHVSVGLGFRVGLGNQAANVTAGMNVGLTAEVGYGHGAGYILKGDIAVDVRAQAQIAGLFEASVGLEKAFSGGVAFYELDDVQAFGNQITGIMSLMDDPVGNRAEIARRASALDAFMEDHAYSGTSTTFEAEIEAPTGVSMSYNRETSNSTYRDYVDANNNNRYDEGEVRTRQDTQDFSEQLTFDAGGVGVSYTRQSSSILSSNHNSGRTGAADQSRVVIGLQVDPAAFAADPSGTFGRVMDNLRGQSRIPLPNGIDQGRMSAALSQSLSDPSVSSSSNAGAKVTLSVAINNDGSFQIVNSNSISYEYEQSVSNGTFIGSVNGNVSMSTGRVLYDSRD